MKEEKCTTLPLYMKCITTVILEKLDTYIDRAYHLIEAVEKTRTIDVSLTRGRCLRESYNANTEVAYI